MATYNILNIADGQLAERAAVVQPLVRRYRYETVNETTFREVDCGLWYVETPSNLRSEFAWSPKWLRHVADGELVPVKKVRTLHTYEHPSMFKPSIAEVLAQAPDDLHKYVAFSVAGPETADDLNRERDALNAGFHVAVTTYYKRATEGTVV